MRAQLSAALHISPRSPLYLPCISPRSPLYLPDQVLGVLGEPEYFSDADEIQTSVAAEEVRGLGL